MTGAAIAVGATIVGPGLQKGTTILSGAGTAWVLSLPATYVVPAGTAFMAATRYFDDVARDAQAEWVIATYGAAHVFDPRPIINSFAIKDVTAAGYWQDQMDMAIGYGARSTTYDSVHLTGTIREAIVNGIPGLPGLAAAIEVVRKLA